MNKGISGSDEKKGNLPDKQLPVGTGKLESKPKLGTKVNTKKPKKEKVVEKDQLPVLVELAYTVSVIVVILATLLVMLVSIFTQASLLDLIIRTSVTIVVIGGLAMVISWQISAGMLAASLEEQEEEKKKMENMAKSQEEKTEELKTEAKGPGEEGNLNNNFEENYGHSIFGEAQEMNNEGIFEAQ